MRVSQGPRNILEIPIYISIISTHVSVVGFVDSLAWPASIVIHMP